MEFYEKYKNTHSKYIQKIKKIIVTNEFNIYRVKNIERKEIKTSQKYE